MLTTARRARLDEKITALANDSELTPLARRLACLRGIAALTGFALALIPYLRTLMNGTTAWDQDPTIKLAIEIRDGQVQNPKIVSFQRRSTDHPHPRL